MNGPIRIVNDFLYLNYEVNEAETERDLSSIDPLTVEFFQNNQTSSVSVILLTNGQMDGRTEGQTNDCDFNTSLVEVITNSSTDTITTAIF